MDLAGQVGVGHFYHIFYEGCLSNFEIGEEGEEASELYPEVQYTRMDAYLKRYLWDESAFELYSYRLILFVYFLIFLMS